MAKVIVKTDHRKNFTGIFPGVGKVSVDHNGEFEADSDSFAELKEHYNEFYNKEVGPDVVTQLSNEEEVKQAEFQDLSGEFDEEELAELAALAEEQKLKESTLQKTELNELSQESKDEIENQTETLTEEEKATYIESLPNSTRKELEEMCAPFAAKEWRGKNKEDLVKFLTEKLK